MRSGSRSTSYPVDHVLGRLSPGPMVRQSLLLPRADDAPVVRGQGMDEVGSRDTAAPPLTCRLLSRFRQKRLHLRLTVVGPPR